MENLFSNQQQNDVPLAERMRPTTLEAYLGQEHLLAPGKALRAAIDAGKPPSLIFWGPPGSGKTTLAKIIASHAKMRFVQLSAVSSGVKELRETVAEAENYRSAKGLGTILFIDEIHRFNKAQQDVLLPYAENGTLTLFGATTENPSFEVNSALLSRCRVFVLEQLSPEHVSVLIRRALTDPRGLGEAQVKITDDAIAFLSQLANGDARVALNALELAVQLAKVAPTKGGAKGKTALREICQREIGEEEVKESLQKTHLRYDKGGEEHYNIISALHKSMRGSNANAALYWLGRMLEAGEDPLYVARRLVRFASEDIGLADPQALVQAVAAFQAAHDIGLPECNVVLAQCVAYLAKTRKSNALYVAYGRVQEDIRTLPNEPVPLHLRNAPTSLMKTLGYGKGYKYTPDFQTKETAVQDYLPPALKDRKYLE